MSSFFFRTNMKIHPVWNIFWVLSAVISAFNILKFILCYIFLYSIQRETNSLLKMTYLFVPGQ